MHRLETRVEFWDRIKDLLPEQVGQFGVTAKDNRLFVNSVPWIGKPDAQWRSIFERFGKWGTAWQCLNRYSNKGFWQQVYDALQNRIWIGSSSTAPSSGRTDNRRERPNRRDDIEALGRSVGGVGKKL